MPPSAVHPVPFRRVPLFFRSPPGRLVRRAAAGTALAAATAVLAACTPVEAGAAIVTRDQRVPTSEVDGLAAQITTDATSTGVLQGGALQVQGTSLSPSQAAVNVIASGLVWDQVAKDQNLTITSAELTTAGNDLAQAAQVSPAQLPEVILATAGYPLARAQDYIRLVAIQEQTVAAHGLPTDALYSQQDVDQVNAILNPAVTRAVDELGLTESPRYTGAQDYLATPAASASSGP